MVKDYEADKKADQREQDTDEQAQSRDRKLDGAVREQDGFDDNKPAIRSEKSVREVG